MVSDWQQQSGETTLKVESTSGVALQVYDLGGTGRPLIFCHATGFCGQVWTPVADRLNLKFPGAFRCLAFDFRGHGRSSLPDDGDLDWAGLGDDVLAVKAAVGPDEPVLAVGHSICLLYTSPSPRDATLSRMPSSA